MRGMTRDSRLGFLPIATRCKRDVDLMAAFGQSRKQQRESKQRPSLNNEENAQAPAL